jgi:NhaP-type Na+/H+ or K+/H+ antiporter
MGRGAPHKTGHRSTMSSSREFSMISLLIGILIICVVGAICFWAIEKFVRDARLANLLKLLVVLICLASILQRVLPLAGINWL